MTETTEKRPVGRPTLYDPALCEKVVELGKLGKSVEQIAYNLNLSERRAASVKQYLSEVHGISEQRLIEKGFGERRLLDPDFPEDGVNRRVQITTLAVPAQ
jgi:hypothetical protein